MSRLARFPNAVRRDAGVQAWLDGHAHERCAVARRWHEGMRACGADVAAFRDLVRVASRDMRGRLEAG